MKRWYITFSGQAWDLQTKRIVDDGPRFGADEVLVYDDRWLETTEFYHLNQWLWHTPRMKGFGWFAWKPFILLHCLEHFMQDGDLVLFTDADTFPIADFSALYSQAITDGGAMFFKAQGCNNRQWVKQDCSLVMGLNPDVHAPWMPPAVPVDSQHAAARFIVIERGQWRPRQLLMEWLAYCLNPFATTFERSRIVAAFDPEAPRHLSSLDYEAGGFQEHRTEQAIMTLLTHKYGFHLYREACQFGEAARIEHGEDAVLFPQLFTQEWGAGPREVGPGSAYRNLEARLAQLRNSAV